VVEWFDSIVLENLHSNASLLISLFIINTHKNKKYNKIKRNTSNFNHTFPFLDSCEKGDLNYECIS
jgi:hypothetical protein